LETRLRSTGKRAAPSIEGNDGGNNIRPSQGAWQYGEADVFGPAYCIAFVEEEQCRILIDTGSSVTIISSEFFVRIKEKVQRKWSELQLTTNVRFEIQGVTGQRTRPLAEVKGIPLQFENRRRIVPYKNKNQARVIIGETSHPLD